MTRCLRTSAAVLVVLLVTGCANEAKDARTVNGPESSASASPGVSTRTGGTKSDGTPYAMQRAGTAVIDKAAMLPKDWRPVPTEGRLSGPPGHPQYCGVAAEPDPIRQSALTLYEEDSSERRILQYTFVSTEKAATAVMDDLRTAARNCHDEGFTVRKASGYTPVGDGSVALDYSTAAGVGSRTVVFRTKDTIVILVGYGNQGAPEVALQTVATTIAGLLSR